MLSPGELEDLRLLIDTVPNFFFVIIFIFYDYKLIHIHYRKLGKYISLKREKGSQRKKQKELEKEMKCLCACTCDTVFLLPTPPQVLLIWIIMD